MTANYKCLNCDHQWIEQTKGGSPEQSHGPTECPECGGLYVLWTDWPATTPNLTPAQQAMIAETFDNPFLTMH